MKIALDYDETYSKAPDMWSDIIGVIKSHGSEVRIVTARNPILDNIDDVIDPPIPIIYCDGIAKRFYCTHFADDGRGWIPDVWIDDKPQAVDNNSTATREALAEWRANRDKVAA